MKQMRQIAMTVVVAALSLAVAAAWVQAADTTGKKPGDKTGPAGGTSTRQPADKSGDKTTGPADKSGKTPAGDKTGSSETSTGPSGKSTGPSSTAPAALTEDQQRAAEIAAKMLAGNVDEALQEAKAFILKTKDEKAKTEAMRVVAECYRKKSDWKQALLAYQQLRDRFKKGADDYAKYDAIWEVMKGSPAGLFQPQGGGVTPAPAPTGSDPTSAPAARKTVADDEGLSEALGRVAQFRSTRLKPRAAVIRRARSPQEVVSAFTPAAEDARQILLIGPDVSPDGPRELVAAAGTRLRDIGKQVEMTLRNKLQKYQAKFENPFSFTNIEEKDVANTCTECKAMAEAEKNFQEAMFGLGGKGDWPDGETFRKESSDRRATYEQLAREFVVPEHSLRMVW